MNRPSEPFNAEERDLAQRLARLGGPREPAPALDAVILAAARAAVAAPAAAVQTPAAPAVPAPAAPRRRAPARQWPMGFGLAASLVLAAGIGWRLQGDGSGSSAQTAGVAAESSVPSSVVTSTEDATEAVMLEPPLQRTPPAPPPPLAAADSADAAIAPAAARRTDRLQAPAAKVADAPAESEALPMTEAPLAAPPPAPPMPPMPSPAAGASANESLDRVVVSGSRVAPQERSVGAAEYTRTPLNERREAAQASKAAPAADAATRATAPGAAPAPAAAPAMQNERARGALRAAEGDAERKARDDFDDRPPVSADSAQFRQAWLQRIRAHLARGEQDEARKSLLEFRRRYPDVELPEDLRKLAVPPPAP